MRSVLTEDQIFGLDDYIEYLFPESGGYDCFQICQLIFGWEGPEEAELVSAIHDAHNLASDRIPYLMDIVFGRRAYDSVAHLSELGAFPDDPEYALDTPKYEDEPHSWPFLIGTLTKVVMGYAGKALYWVGGAVGVVIAWAIGAGALIAALVFLWAWSGSDEGSEVRTDRAFDRAYRHCIRELRDRQKSRDDREYCDNWMEQNWKDFR